MSRMAIFSRRTLQRMLDDNARFLTGEQLEKLVDHLNRHTSALQDEWEISLLWCLSQFGAIEHEPNMRGKEPDVFFAPGGDEEFLGDVIAVSDEGLEGENPVNQFEREFWQQLSKRKLDGGGFDWEIGRKSGARGKKVVCLPAKGELHRVFSPDFKRFLDSVAAEPAEAREFSASTEDIDVRFQYRPDQDGMTSGHPSYRDAHSLRKNPVFNALKRKKNYLKETGYQGPKVIFLCDRGCHILRHDPFQGESYGLDAIVHDFLRQNTSISWVTVVSTQTKVPPQRGMVPFIRVRNYRNSRASNPLHDRAAEALDDLERVMPAPVNDAVNAANWYRGERRKSGPSRIGGMMGDANQVTLSARGTLELLAGRITQDEFFEVHGFRLNKGPRGHRNPFRAHLDNGELFKGVQLKLDPDSDDDWITFRFDGPDPAVSKFVNPKADQED